MNSRFVKPSRRIKWRMRKGALLKQKQQKGKGSDRHRHSSRKGRLIKERLMIADYACDLHDKCDLNDQDMVTERSVEIHGSTDARRAVDLYMEERALRKAFAEDDY
ncbi:MAG: hypothetical protein EP297_08270 [Gammaproteobacteria bacterium]|nr:MAG: hypothetical protein EP297_08270 [Gammaproteobacteria bacterium]